MSFPFGNWPTGKLVLHGLSECRKACFSNSNGLEHIMHLDSREHKEGCLGGKYPTPKQVGMDDKDPFTSLITCFIDC